LLGESGSGKTTLLRIIAGFEVADQGNVKLSETVLFDTKKFVQPEKRGIGMVFQDYALFPHLNVLKNISFGLKGSSDEKAKRSAELLKLVELTGYEKRYPHELSGGQQQRIAIARALAPSPSLILLDEPFSNLDESLKNKVRQDIQAILKKAGTTAIFVTHDTKDALAVADKVIVLHEGKMQQNDTPQRLYQHPANLVVARLFGHTNIINAAVNGGKISTAFGELTSLKQTAPINSIVVPKQSISITTEGALAGTIIQSQFAGASYAVTIVAADSQLILNSDKSLEVGATVRFDIDMDKTIYWS
jgi:iron(III) transport system ATP-binding protein